MAEWPEVVGRLAAALHALLVATTPIWVPLVVAFLGLGGILLTQRRADRREDARWRREREREQALWAREDAARSYEHRRAAYVDFITEFNRRWMHYRNVTDKMEGEKPKSEPPADYLDPLYDRLVQIQIFGTNEAARLGEEAFKALAFHVILGEKMTDGALEPLQSEIRRDLSIPDRPDDLGSGSQSVPTEG